MLKLVPLKQFYNELFNMYLFLIVVWDRLPFIVYDFDPVVEVYRKDRWVRVLRNERADREA